MDAIGAAAALPDRLRSLLFHEFAQIAPGRAHPAEFLLNSYRVQISRTPESDLLVHPCPSQCGQALMQVLLLYPQGQGICEHYAVQATALKRRATPIGANSS